MRHVIGWRNDAVCARVDRDELDKFFPVGRPSTTPQRLCRECPVREACLEFALDSPWQPRGIVAGLTPGELEPMWRQRHPIDSSQSEVQTFLGIRERTK